MGYSRKSLAKAIAQLRENGIDGVVIGSTVYMVRLGFHELEDDVDLFTTSIMPSFDEDVVLNAAETLGCFLGQNEWGGPQLKCPIDEEEVTVELHENIYDFYVPQEILDDAETLSVAGVDVRMIRVEDYLVLKAKAGRDQDLEDLRYLSDLIKNGKLKIRKELLRQRLSLFDEYESKLIIKRLRDSGISM